MWLIWSLCWIQSTLKRTKFLQLSQTFELMASGPCLLVSKIYFCTVHLQLESNHRLREEGTAVRGPRRPIHVALQQREVRRDGSVFGGQGVHQPCSSDVQLSKICVLGESQPQLRPLHGEPGSAWEDEQGLSVCQVPPLCSIALMILPHLQHELHCEPLHCLDGRHNDLDCWGSLWRNAERAEYSHKVRGAFKNVLADFVR